MSNSRWLKRIFLFAVLVTSAMALSQTSSTSHPGTATATAKSSTAGKTAKTSEVIDINSASKEELQTLPGIGEAYAQKIIAGRPYRSKNQLVSKNIIPKATYEKIKEKIVAHQKK